MQGMARHVVGQLDGFATRSRSQHDIAGTLGAAHEYNPCAITRKRRLPRITTFGDLLQVPRLPHH